MADRKKQFMSSTKTIEKKPMPKKKTPELIHYRSCTIALITLVNDLKKSITDKHLELIKKTPFGAFFLAVHEGNITKETTTKCNEDISKILEKYDRLTKKFKFGSKKISLKAEDISSIFGLPMEGATVKIGQSNPNSLRNSFFKRVLFSTGKIKVQQIRQELKVAVLGEDQESIEDFVRLLTMFMASTIFFANNNNTLQLFVANKLVDFTELSNISWVKFVHEYLMTNLNSSHSLLTGCTIAILYWFCEKVHIMEPKSENKEMTPTIVRWDLMELHEKISARNLDMLKEEEVTSDADEEQLEEDNVEEKLRNLEDENGKLKQEVNTLKERNEILTKRVLELERQMEEKQEKEKTEISDVLHQLNTEYKDEEEKQEKEEVGDSDDDFQSPPEEVWMPKKEEHSDDDFQSPPAPKRVDVAVTEIKVYKKRRMTQKVVNTDETIKGSIERGVKERKRSKAHDENNIYKYEEEKKKKVVEVENIEIPEEKMQVKKLEDVKLSCIWQKLDDRKKQPIKDFFDGSTINDLGWQDKNKIIFISGCLINDLMFCRSIDSQVIDWYNLKLEREQQKSIAINRNIFFSPFAWESVESKNASGIKLFIKEKMKEINNDDAEIIYFPINHKKSAKDRSGFHWTLLVLIYKEWKWYFCNSMKPRPKRGKKVNQKKDKYMKDALKMKESMLKFFQEHYEENNIGREIENKDIEEIDCPQQDPVSVDCGIFVCEYMRRFTENTCIGDEFPEEKVDAMRGEMVYEMITDVEYGWEATKKDTEVFHTDYY